jgi:hypothetical protein
VDATSKVDYAAEMHCSPSFGMTIKEKWQASIKVDFSIGFRKKIILAGHFMTTGVNVLDIVGYKGSTMYDRGHHSRSMFR